MLEFRVAELRDLPSLLPLANAYHRFEGIEQSAETCARSLTPLLSESALGRIWLVYSEGRLAGYAAVCFGYSIEFGGRDAFLDELFLLEEYRGKGIGHAVVQEIIIRLRALGICAVHLEVAQSNESARRFYSSLGFEARSRFSLMSCRVPRVAQPGVAAEPPAALRLK